MTRVKGDFTRLASNLQALSPLASLARGYAVVRKTEDKEIVRSAKEAPAGTKLDVALYEGSLKCMVEKASLSLRDSRSSRGER
jgi:exodeoxyribonuclease VII large subunit